MSELLLLLFLAAAPCQAPAAAEAAPAPASRIGAAVLLQVEGQLSEAVTYCLLQLQGRLSGRTWCLDGLATQRREAGVGLSLEAFRETRAAGSLSVAIGLGALAPLDQVEKPAWRVAAYATVRY